MAAKILFPGDDRVVAEVPLATSEQVETILATAAAVAKEWKAVPVRERVEYCRKFVAAFVAKKDEIARELTLQMGRPISQTPGEVNGFQARATYMIDVAEECLKDVAVQEMTGFTRFIRKEPLGVVFVIGAWNYPYLITVNCVIPSILAGNAVILKQSSNTLLCADRFADAFREAGLPKGVFQVLHSTHEVAEKVIKDPRVNFVNFTGSVSAGHTVQTAAASKFIATGLELGGKDPAYVRSDCNLDYTVEQLVDGAFFNSGQCCCAIERIYVHEKVYDDFVKKFVELTKQYRLGDPLDTNVNLGPMIKASAADFVRGQIKDAVDKGAKALIDVSLFPLDKVNPSDIGYIPILNQEDDGQPGSKFMAPQVLVDVNHSMSVMWDESFGPVIGIMKVSSDEEAVKLMNDSPFGLTASVWTSDEAAAIAIGDKIETGTWFMNRCDYLDPALAWVGVKDSGRGCALSKMAFDTLTRPKSFHLKKVN